MHHVLNKSTANYKTNGSRFFNIMSNAEIRENNRYARSKESYFEHIISYLAGSKRILILSPDATSESFYMHFKNSQ